MNTHPDQERAHQLRRVPKDLPGRVRFPYAVNHEVFTLTLKIPPVQNVHPKTSFSAHAMLGSRRPPPSLHARSRCAYIETWKCTRATKNQLILSKSDGCTSPPASRAFQSAAACTRAAQAASKRVPSVPASREGSSFQRSVAWSVRW